MEGRIYAVNWNESLSVNNAKLDDDHKKIVSKINEIIDASKKHEEMYRILSLITELTELAKIHFSFEESHFIAHNYNDSNHHCKLHMDFLKKLKVLSSEFEENKTPQFAIKITEFVSDWFLNHMKTEDKKYAQYINSKHKIPKGLK